MKPFFVYLLKCSDGSYYGGQTDDMAARMFQHDAGEIGYTSTRKPVELVWQGEFETRAQAIAFEQQIKGWSRVKKEALIRGDWTAVQRHAWGTKNPLPAHLAGEGPSIPQGDRGLGDTEADVQGGKRVISPSPVHPDSAPVRSEGTLTHSNTTPVRPEVSKGSSSSGGNLPFNLLENVLGDKPEFQRRAIAKAITLLESTRTDHRAQGDELLTALLPHTGKAMRLGISGVPGV
ncbi:MAG: GIY-YIG nuclease family protein, partial [Polaromonas sp.]